MSKVLVVILAGGQGERLSLLAEKRAKARVSHRPVCRTGSRAPIIVSLLPRLRLAQRMAGYRANRQGPLLVLHFVYVTPMSHPTRYMS